MSLEKFLKECDHFEVHEYQLGLDMAKKLIRIVREMHGYILTNRIEGCLKRCDEIASE